MPAIEMDSFLDRIVAQVPPHAAARTTFGSVSLSSRYQPIYSAAGHGILGYEALLVAVDRYGLPLAPNRLFERILERDEGVYLDWLARALHLRSFHALGPDAGKLFLNVTPHAAIEDAKFASVFRDLLGHYGVAPSDVVIEVLEMGVTEERLLSDAVDLYKSLGCAVAIDDFGTGVTEMERVWRLQPDIVKTDRAVLRAAARGDHGLRVLKSVVRMLHECGARVVVEGVEERSHALIALEANADFVQGFYFARPSPEPADPIAAGLLFDELSPSFDRVSRDADALRAPEAAHAEAIEATAMALETGATFLSAVPLLLDAPTAIRGYLVRGDGRILASSFHRLACVAERMAALHAIPWNVHRLVRRAASEPGIVMQTPAYDAFGGAHQCKTYSYGFAYEGEPAVLCADVVVA